MAASDRAFDRIMSEDGFEQNEEKKMIVPDLRARGADRQLALYFNETLGKRQGEALPNARRFGGAFFLQCFVGGGIGAANSRSTGGLVLYGQVLVAGGLLVA